MVGLYYGETMTKQPTLGIIFVLCISLLAACSSNPAKRGGSDVFVPLTDKPGDISFGSPEADLIYEILVGEIATQRGQPEVAASYYLNAAKVSQNAEIAARAARPRKKISHSKQPRSGQNKTLTIWKPHAF